MSHVYYLMSDVVHIHCKQLNNDTSSVRLMMLPPLIALSTNDTPPHNPPPPLQSIIPSRDHPTSVNVKAPRFSGTFLSVWG